MKLDKRYFNPFWWVAYEGTVLHPFIIIPLFIIGLTFVALILVSFVIWSLPSIGWGDVRFFTLIFIIYAWLQHKAIKEADDEYR